MVLTIWAHLFAISAAISTESTVSIISKSVTAFFTLFFLQKNKVKKAVTLFDMIETVDSVEIAAEIAKRCAQIVKTMPVLIEINSGREAQKAGVYPENAEQLISAIATMKNIRVTGLMTMGPLTMQAEELRPCFRG